jgi:hypothetical protein
VKAQASELVGLVVIGLVGRPVGFGLVWSSFVIGLVWFGLRLLVLVVWSIPFWDMQKSILIGRFPVRQARWVLLVDDICCIDHKTFHRSSSPP